MQPPPILQQAGSRAKPDGAWLERVYLLVAEGIASGLYLPNRGSSVCSRRYCNFWQECENLEGSL
jgi:hypothetical protein